MTIIKVTFTVKKVIYNEEKCHCRYKSPPQKLNKTMATYY